MGKVSKRKIFPGVRTARKRRLTLQAKFRHFLLKTVSIWFPGIRAHFGHAVCKADCFVYREMQHAECGGGSNVYGGSDNLRDAHVNTRLEK